MHEEQARARSRDLDRQPDTVTRRDPHAPWSPANHDRRRAPTHRPPRRVAALVSPRITAMTEGAPARRRLGPRSMLVLRIVVSAALLALVASKASGVDDAIPDQHHALTISAARRRRAHRPGRRGPLGLALAAGPAAVRRAGADSALFSHYVVGLLVGNVLPSTIGGDVVRGRAGRTRSARPRCRSVRSFSSGSPASSRCRCSCSRASRSDRR